MADYFKEARLTDTTMAVTTADTTPETTALAAPLTEGPTPMAYPPGVSLATITIGAGRTMFGAPPKLISATVTPIFKGTPHVVHATSGWAFYPTPQTFRVVDGEELTFELPHVNAEGWRDTAGNEFPALLESGEHDKGWAYHAKFTVVGGSGQDAVPHRYEKVFQPLVGQTQPLDIDLVPDGQVGEPVSAPVASVTSILGLVGEVSASDLDAAGFAVGASDEDIALLVQDETTATGAALSSTYALKDEVGGVEQNAALVGAPLYAYGHSYPAGTGVTDPLAKWTSIFQREYMGASGQVNRAVGGHTMEMTLTEIVANSTRRWIPGTKGVIVLESVLNNVLRTNTGNEFQTVISFRNALTAALRVLRSGTYTLHTDATVVLTGTWQTTTWSTARAGNLRGSSVSGDTIKITGYTDTEIGLMLWAGKLPTSVEARYDVLVNGAKFGDTRDLSNKWSSESDINPSAGQAMFCEWITGLPTGTKEITVQVLPSSANTAKTLYFDGYLKPNPAPPTVIVVKDPPVGTYTGAALTTEEAHILMGRLNGVIDDVVREFNRPGEVVTADAGIGFVPSSMLGGTTGTDLLHPNTAGHAAIAKAVYRTAQGLPYRWANFA